MGKPSFLTELRRRHVIRIALAYVVTAWLLVQLGAILLPTFGAPHWVLKALVGLLILLFPVALILAWAFESTPEGVRRTVPANAEQVRPAGHGRRVGQVLNVGIIVVLAAAVGVLAWRLAGTRSTQQAAPVAVAATAGAPTAAPAPTQGTVIPAKSIAVLPFENLSSDKNNAYFADGMQDLILTKLADIGDLKVISRTSTMKYASHPDDLKSIGQQLGVATILEGSVQKAGDQVLVNVQLINARTDAHLWANSYQRKLDNVFGVEGEVAEKVATALNAKLSPQATAQLASELSGNPAANDLYLRAEYFTNQAAINFDSTRLKQAIPLYRKAIAMAPDFALARARLSYAESGLVYFGGGGEDVKQLNADARAQADQALRLAPNLPEAQVALGYSLFFGRLDFAASTKAFAAALKLRPNDVDALIPKGFLQRAEGHFDAAIDTYKQAQKLDPRNTVVAFHLGITYMMVSRWPEAEATLRRALALDPTNVQAKLELSRTLLLADGDFPAALNAAAGDDPQLRQRRVWLLTLQHKYRQALALLEGIPDTPDNFSYFGGPKALQQADLTRLMGDSAKAHALYQKALPQARAQMATTGGIAYRQSMVWSSIADAKLGLGQTRKAFAALAKSQALAEKSPDLWVRVEQMVVNAALYAQAGRVDLAVPMLAKALASPGIGFAYSPVMLWLDPSWDPIRKSPAFQDLLKKYAKYKPASIPETTHG